MIAALFFAAALAAPASAASDLAAARGLYDAGRYPEAAEAFAALSAAAPRDAALQYDLGDAQFKAGRVGPAVASFERAFALDPRDSDIRENLSYALGRAGEELVPPGTPPALFLLFTALSERELAGLDWLCAWIALLLAAAALARPRLRAGLRAWIWSAAALWALFGLWRLGLRGVLPPESGVVVSAKAELRHGPGDGFGVAFTVPEGRRVRVLGSSGAWLEVGLLKEGARGWIAASAVERL
jgi:tetratricopeptide (TPR) repeat protein